MPGEAVVDHQRNATDLDAHYPFVPAKPVKARYATFVAQANVWLMLSEIRLFSGGRNVIAGKPYTLQPPPTAVRGYASYPDDGLLLTDGIVANGFSISTVYGWSNDKERTVEVDLGRLCRVDEVTAWSVTGSHAAIFLPKQVRLALSNDGAQWREVGTAGPPAIPDEPSVAAPFAFKLGPDTARYLRVTVTPSRNWCMISEIEVKGQPK
jgi:hypothetical protein